MANRAAEIHDGLRHPVIDGDGHWLEPIPIFLEYLNEVGGAKLVDQMRSLWRASARTESVIRSPPARPRKARICTAASNGRSPFSNAR